MRKLFIFLVLLSSLLMISCETAGPVNPGLFSLPVQWVTTLQRTTDGEQGVFLEQTSDGGYVVLVEYTDTLNPSNERALGDNGVKLSKLDNIGEPQWTYELPDKSDAYDEKGAFVIRNGYVKAETYLIGVNKIDKNDSSDIKLSYVNNSGNLIWETSLSGSGNDVICGALILDQYKALVYGKTNSYDGSFDNRPLNYDDDGFIFVINNENGEISERHYYDSGRVDNSIKRVLYNPADPQKYFIIGEINDGKLNKLWMRKIAQLNATASYDHIFKADDAENYFFGGITETGLNSYVLGCEKNAGGENDLGFYGFNTTVENNALVVSFSFEIDHYSLETGSAAEQFIGFSPFSDGESVLIGTKHGSESSYRNTFLLLNRETGAIKQQEYRYKAGVVYEHLNGNPLSNTYGLTGSVTPAALESNIKRVAGGHAAWVESL